MGESMEEGKSQGEQAGVYRPIPDADRVPPSIVRLKSIDKTFYRGKEPIRVLEKLDLDVPEGSFEALMGP